MEKESVEKKGEAKKAKVGKKQKKRGIERGKE